VRNGGRAGELRRGQWHSPPRPRPVGGTTAPGRERSRIHTDRGALPARSARREGARTSLEAHTREGIGRVRGVERESPSALGMPPARAVCTVSIDPVQTALSGGREVGISAFLLPKIASWRRPRRARPLRRRRGTARQGPRRLRPGTQSWHRGGRTRRLHRPLRLAAHPEPSPQRRAHPGFGLDREGG
jgi:hypothetical protein